MRFHSTPESILRGEITKLAIIECIASVILYVSVGLYLGTFRHLAAAVAVAPLMLLRTDDSAEWGLRVYVQFLEHLERLLGRWLRFHRLGALIMLVLAPISGSMIRVVAVLYWAARKPLRTLHEVPGNWLRQSFCTDIFHPPEIVPLESTRGDPYKIPTFMDLVNLRRGEKAPWESADLITALPPLVLGYLPSVIYRVSFKATALAYAPFVWVAHTTLRNPLPIKVRLERITKGELEKVRRAVSWIVVTMLVAKIGLRFGWVDLSYIAAKFPSQTFVDALVVPQTWPWWQITLGVDALLTFFLLYFADAALARVENPQAWPSEVVLNVISLVSLLRATVSIITLCYAFYTSVIEVLPGSVRHLLTF